MRLRKSYRAMKPLQCINPDCSKPLLPWIGQQGSLSSNNKYCPSCGVCLVLCDKYHVTHYISDEGGFGRVFLATNILNLSKCAVKQRRNTLERGKRHENKSKELFEQEFQTLKRLSSQQHENRIMKFIDYFSHPLYFSNSIQKNRNSQYHYDYLITEFIDGETLEKELNNDQSRKNFSDKEILDILQSIATDISILQDNNIIHRDIKPENIMRRKNDRSLVLIDFGGVKEITLTNLNKTATRIYSEGYSPPEQSKKGQVNKTSDIYALGITCIHLLTGKPLSILYNDSNEFAWEVHTTNTNPYLLSILRKMIKIDPKERYQSARELLADLLPLLKLEMDKITLKADRDGEKLRANLRIKNSTLLTYLNGEISVQENINDTRKSSSKHPWIYFEKRKFSITGDQYFDLKIDVDTSKLMPEKIFRRNLIISSNCQNGDKKIELEVHTGKLSIKTSSIEIVSRFAFLAVLTFISTLLIFHAYENRKSIIDLLSSIFSSVDYQQITDEMNEQVDRIWR